MCAPAVSVCKLSEKAGLHQKNPQQTNTTQGQATQKGGQWHAKQLRCQIGLNGAYRRKQRKGYPNTVDCHQKTKALGKHPCQCFICMPLPGVPIL